MYLGSAMRGTVLSIRYMGATHPTKRGKAILKTARGCVAPKSIRRTTTFTPDHYQYCTMPQGQEGKTRIIDFTPAHAEAFKSLNEEWINKHFCLEESDRIVLENPQANIIEKGGWIYMALMGDELVGTCALIKSKEEGFDFELAKMAVVPQAQGRGIGRFLAQAVILKAKELGGKILYLESNNKLTTALILYQKLGFQEATNIPTPYARCDIQMTLAL